ncbi:uncharacterized protein LOC121053796 [Oryza brachyantha]|uniref:uncharacterized protein LOC121053796 n=1 Tax=Oryza brachyantha TaxID=4533 RepID=UPI001ADC63EF|nr:uncharacterized protein LOC121053796 [Oryza brachyantha]
MIRSKFTTILKEKSGPFQSLSPMQWKRKSVKRPKGRNTLTSSTSSTLRARGSSIKEKPLDQRKRASHLILRNKEGVRLRNQLLNLQLGRNSRILTALSVTVMDIGTKTAPASRSGWPVKGLNGVQTLRKGEHILRVADGAEIEVEAVGDLALKLPSGYNLILNNVLVAPSVKRNLISVRVLYRALPPPRDDRTPSWRPEADSDPVEHEDSGKRIQPAAVR